MRFIRWELALCTALTLHLAQAATAEWQSGAVNDLPWSGAHESADEPVVASDYEVLAGTTSLWYRTRSPQCVLASHNRSLTLLAQQRVRAAVQTVMDALALSNSAPGTLQVFIYRDTSESEPVFRSRVEGAMPLRWVDDDLIVLHQRTPAGAFRLALVHDDIPYAVARALAAQIAGGTGAPDVLVEGFARTFERTINSNLAVFAAAVRATPDNAWAPHSALLAGAADDGGGAEDSSRSSAPAAAWGMFLRQELPPARLCALLNDARSGAVVDALARAFALNPFDAASRLDERVRTWLLATYPPGSAAAAPQHAARHTSFSVAFIIAVAAVLVVLYRWYRGLTE